MMLEPLLKGKVLKILDQYRVIVDIGYEKGIKNNMKFIIYSLGEEIYDPETGLAIDRLEIIKHRMKVTQIQEKFSILKSDEQMFEHIFLAGTVTKLKPLETDEKVPQSSENNQRKIKVGDLVRQDVS
ncbi:MAG: hypothetical protein ACYDDV_07285 [Methanoregula sp.]